MSTPDLLANTGTAIVRDANDNVYSTTSTEGTILLEKETALEYYNGRLFPAQRFH